MVYLGTIAGYKPARLHEQSTTSAFELAEKSMKGKEISHGTMYKDGPLFGIYSACRTS